MKRWDGWTPVIPKFSHRRHSRSRPEGPLSIHLSSGPLPSKKCSPGATQKGSLTFQRKHVSPPLPLRRESPTDERYWSSHNWKGGKVEPRSLFRLFPDHLSQWSDISVPPSRSVPTGEESSPLSHDFLPLPVGVLGLCLDRSGTCSVGPHGSTVYGHNKKSPPRLYFYCETGH